MMKMASLLLLISLCSVGVVMVCGESMTYRVPINLGPGDVSNTVFSMKVPQGHVGIREMFAEVVDEIDNPVPLSEVYLHHWTMYKEFVKKNRTGLEPFEKNEWILVRNSGLCQTLPQWYGLGSETRHTNNTILAPYAIVMGDPKEVPEGFEEEWLLNVHAIDTRGAVNRRGCTECLCELYNMTNLELPEGYVGGLACCGHKQHCRVKEEFQGESRTLFFKYSVQYVPVDSSVIPVRVYVMDSTDGRKKLEDKGSCKVEYMVEQCDVSKNEVCEHEQTSVSFFPEDKDVDILYVVGHQHTGGKGIYFEDQDHQEICASIPTYGEGVEAGNEKGYIVGMSTCFFEPGTKTIRAGEKLHLKSMYSSNERHTGVMGLMYFLVADPIDSVPHRNLALKIFVSLVAILAALGVIVISLTKYAKIKRSTMGYESLGHN